MRAGDGAGADDDDVDSCSCTEDEANCGLFFSLLLLYCCLRALLVSMHAAAS